MIVDRHFTALDDILKKLSNTGAELSSEELDLLTTLLNTDVADPFYIETQEQQAHKTAPTLSDIFMCKGRRLPPEQIKSYHDQFAAQLLPQRKYCGAAPISYRKNAYHISLKKV